MGTAEHTLADLVDLDRLQRVCDSLSAAGGIGTAVLDPAGTVLVAAGWQDICVRFHRVHEDTLRGCLESDQGINQRLRDGLHAPGHYAYRCANGLWDVAFPLVIAGEHLGTVFTGQFFYDDDEIDEAAFRQRARRLGFDEPAYLEALARVPVLSHEHVAQTIGFLADFVGMLADLGLAALRLEQEHEALSESEALYRSILSASPDDISITDLEGRLRIASPAAVAMFGYEREEEMLGRVFTDFLVPEDRERAQANVALMHQGIFTGPGDYHGLRGDGSTFAIEVNGEFIRDTGEQPTGMVFIARDITQRTLTEEELRENQLRYEIFINATDDMAFLKDHELRYVIVNAANAAYFGRSVEETVGQTDADLMPPEAAARCRHSDRDAMEGHDVVISHEEVDGRIYETRKFPVVLADDQVGVGGYVRDITERRRAEEALEKRILALTQPPEKAGDIAFEDLFNLKDIQRLQDDFAKATGVASVITHVDGTPITTPSSFCRLCSDIIRETDKGRANCYRSDAAVGGLHPEGPTIRPCMSGGLWDAGAAITAGGRHIANWLIGQVRDETQTEARMAEYAREIGADEQAFLEAFSEVPAMSRTRFGLVADALFSLASQLSTTAYQNVQQARFISERKETDERLAAAARQWRQTFDAMTDSVALFDREGRVLRCNAATTALADRGFDDIVGRPCFEVFHDAAASHRLCPRQRALDSGQTETSIIEQDGHWLRVTFQPLTDDEGRISGGVHMVTDVSELKHAEQGLLESLTTQQTITDGVIAALARTIEVRDPYTAGHQRRVSELGEAMALHMGLGVERAEGVRVGGMLHDVGKVNIPAEILSKPGRLTTLEFELIKGHAQSGFEILAAIHFPWRIAEMTQQHHERQDGSGYPAGLGGDEILPEARILAVADVVEAMASHRPYRPAMGIAAALDEVRSGAGTRYDADAVAACEGVFEQGFVFTES